MMAERDAWRIWDREASYGELLFRRATGELPEMESSKAVARLISSWVKPNDRILDVGCGAGHYLRSLRRVIQVPFSYMGVDATCDYIELARKAWHDDPQADFQVADVSSLPFQNGEYAIVLACNLFLHLPSITAPLREITRVAGRHALVRTLIGDRSFRIQEVYSPETHPRSFAGKPDEDEFDATGEPRSFHFYNIYSQSHISKLLARLPDIAGYKIVKDGDFEPMNLTIESRRTEAAPDTTEMIGGWQVNGYILQPWHFVLIDKRVE
jgi:SAM-dependent methyltransferase